MGDIMNRVPPTLVTTDEWVSIWKQQLPSQVTRLVIRIQEVGGEAYQNVFPAIELYSGGSAVTPHALISSVTITEGLTTQDVFG